MTDDAATVEDRLYFVEIVSAGEFGTGGLRIRGGLENERLPVRLFACLLPDNAPDNRSGGQKEEQYPSRIANPVLQCSILTSS